MSNVHDVALGVVNFWLLLRRFAVIVSNCVLNKLSILEQFYIHRKIVRIIQRVPIHPTPSCPFYRHLTFVWYICHNQLINIDTLLTKAHTLFRFPWFLPNILSAWSPCGILHYIRSSCLLRLLLALTVSQTFFVFDDFQSFEEHRLCIPVIVCVCVCVVWGGFLF